MVRITLMNNFILNNINMKPCDAFYAALDASKIDEYNFEDFVQNKESVRFNKLRTKFIVQYVNENFVVGKPIMRCSQVQRLLRTMEWK